MHRRATVSAVRTPLASEMEGRKRARPSRLATEPADAADTSPPPSSGSSGRGAKRQRRPTRSSAGAALVPPVTPVKAITRSKSESSSRGSTTSSTGGSSSGTSSGSSFRRGSGKGDKKRAIAVVLQPPPAPAVLHVGAAAANIVASWLATRIEAQPGPDGMQLEIVGGRRVATQPTEALESLLEDLGHLLGSVGGHYTRTRKGAQDGGEEELRVGGSDLVACLAARVVDPREAVAHAACRGLMHLVRAAASRWPCWWDEARRGWGTALGFLGRLALDKVLTKMGDYRPDFRCWAIELLGLLVQADRPDGAYGTATQQGRNRRPRLLSSEHRAALVGALSDPNREARHLAVAALARALPLAEDEVPATHVRAMVDLLEDTSLAVRCKAVNLLAQLPPPVVPAMLQRLPDKLAHPVRGTRFMALEVMTRLPLGRYEDSLAACLPHLLRRLGDRAPCVRRQAAALLGALPLEAATRLEVAEEALARAGSPALSANCRVAAMGVLGRLNRTLVAPHAGTIASHLADPCAAMRLAAAEAVANLSSAALAPHVPRLGTLLADADWRVRRAAVQALAERDLACVGCFTRDLARLLETDEEEGVRAACLATLGTLPPTEAILPFCGTMVRVLRGDPSRQVQLAALRTLAKLPWPALAPHLDGVVAASLHDESSALRETALGLLASLPVDVGAAVYVGEVVGRVQEATEAAPAVRALALEVLVGLPPQVLQPHAAALRAAARHDSDARLRAAAARALRQLQDGRLAKGARVT